MSPILSVFILSILKFSSDPDVLNPFSMQLDHYIIEMISTFEIPEVFSVNKIRDHKVKDIVVLSESPC